MNKYFYVALILGLFGQMNSPAQTTAKKPNVLFIIPDDHCAQAIGSYHSRLESLNSCLCINS